MKKRIITTILVLAITIPLHGCLRTNSQLPPGDPRGIFSLMNNPIGDFLLLLTDTPDRWGDGRIR